MTRLKYTVLLVAFVLSLPGCEKIYEAPVPDVSWDLFESNDTAPVPAGARMPLEGIYKVTTGDKAFGEQVAMKWSYHVEGVDTAYRLSILCEKDIAYFVLEGKRSGDSLIFNGYWRKMINVETGAARLWISRAHGAGWLLGLDAKGDVNDIILNGLWGNDNRAPVLGLAMNYLRALNTSEFQMLAHRAGGRTADHLPYAENSVGMIGYASRMGASGIEIDIRLTSDGIPILYHDNTLNPRLVQKNGLVGPIENYTFNQIRTLVKLIDGEDVPTLDEALHEVLYNTPLRFVWLDTKNAAALVAIRNLQSSYLQRANAMGRDLQIVIGLPEKKIVDAFRGLPGYDKTPALCELSLTDVASTNSQIWGPRWTQGTLDNEVAEIHSQGKKAFVWTIDNPDFVRQFVERDLFDGILSNYPSVVAYYHYAEK